MKTLVLLIIVVICILYYYRKDTNSNSSALDRSNGTFDAPAKEALSTIEHKTEKTARDYIDRADIVFHNILEDDLGKVPDADRENVANAIAGDYITGAAMLAPDDPVAGDVAQRMRNIVLNTDPDLQRAIEESMNTTLRAARNIERKHADARLLTVRRQLRSRAGRATVSSKYLRDSVHYESDRQNAHDSQVNADLRATFAIIADPLCDKRAAIDEIRARLPQGGAARTALEKIALGGFISALNTSEDYVLACVWNRAAHPENADNAENIRAAIIRALGECIEGTGMVCANGRVSRIIGSLAALDFNSRVGNIGSYQMYKNEIIKASHIAMDRELERLRKTSPEEVRAWDNGDAAPTVVAQLKKVIEAECDKFANKLSAQSLDTVKDICLKAVE